MSSMETFNNAVLRQLPPPTKLAGCPTTRFVTSLSELCASRRKVHPCTIEQTYHHHHHHRHQRKRITRVTSLLRSHVSAKLVYLCNLPVIGGFRYFSIRTSRWSCIFFSFSSFSRARRRSSFSRGLRIVSPCLPRERQREREREFTSSVRSRAIWKMLSPSRGNSSASRCETAKFARRQVSKGRKRQLLRWCAPTEKGLRAHRWNGKVRGGTEGCK